jgi:hypothetical protein
LVDCIGQFRFFHTPTSSNNNKKENQNQQVRDTVEVLFSCELAPKQNRLRSLHVIEITVCCTAVRPIVHCEPHTFTYELLTIIRLLTVITSFGLSPYLSAAEIPPIYPLAPPRRANHVVPACPVRSTCLNSPGEDTRISWTSPVVPNTPIHTIAQQAKAHPNNTTG